MVFQSLIGLLGLKLKQKMLVRFYQLTLNLTLLLNIVVLLFGALLAAETEASGDFNLVKDEDFDPARCALDIEGALLEEAERPSCADAHEYVDPTEQCATMAGCEWLPEGRLYGKFGNGMTKAELVELIRESWKALLVIGLVIIGILLTAVMGSKYVAKHVKDEPGVRTTRWSRARPRASRRTT